MKLSLSTAGIFAFAATVSTKKCSNKCLRAIVSDTPLALGQAFCSSFLSIEPLAPVTATVTVTHDVVVTTTNTNSETTTTTVTTTDATITTVTGTVTPFAKRAQASADPVAASILSACKTKSARISRICSSLVTTTASAATSTLTVDETATQTTVVEYTTTAVETTVTTVTATSAAVATQSISNPIINGDFSEGLLRWRSSAANGETLGRVEYFATGNVCVDTETNCHMSALIRIIAPITGARYVAISQTFAAAPSTTYKLSMLLHSAYAGPAGVTAIQALFQGADLGTFEANTPVTQQNFKTISVWEFTTDSTGLGTLEIRFFNRAGGGNEYIYLDDIAATGK